MKKLKGNDSKDSCAEYAVFSSETSRGICPPSMIPVFGSKAGLEMTYMQSDGSIQNVNYGKVSKLKENPKQPAIPNLRKRCTPYNRILESKRCQNFESRENRKLRNGLGLRYLRSGSIGIGIIVNDIGSVNIISNPLPIADEFPVPLMESVSNYLKKYLSTNPINRQSLECPHYHEYSRQPLIMIEPEKFRSSAIKVFLSKEKIPRNLLAMQSAISDISEKNLRKSIQQLQKDTNIQFKAESTKEWDYEKVKNFAVFAFLLYPEFYVLLFRGKLKTEEYAFWDNIIQEIKNWRTLHHISGFILETKFSINMKDTQ